MVGGTAVTVIKYLLFIFNLLFWLSGIGLIAAGSYVQVVSGPYESFYGKDFLAAPIILIVTGCIITVLGFLGCCGAMRENYCMLITFSVVLGVIFACEIAAGVVAFVYRHEVGLAIRHQMQTIENQYNPTTNPQIVKKWDEVQQHLKCCGVDSYLDWANEKYFQKGKDVPDSCCRNVTKGCGQNARASQLLSKKEESGGKPEKKVESAGGKGGKAEKPEKGGEKEKEDKGGKEEHAEEEKRGGKEKEEKGGEKEEKRGEKEPEEKRGEKEDKRGEKEPSRDERPEESKSSSRDSLHTSRKVMKRETEQKGAIYTTGCVPAMKKMARRTIYLVGAIGIGIGFLQIIGIALACALGHGVRRGYDTV